MIKQLKPITTADGRAFETHLFQSNLFTLLPKQISSQFTFSDRIKLLLRVWRGYRLYFLTEQETLCAYTFIKRNYLHKYAFMRKGDLLVNPYYVNPEYRGCGLAQKMLQLVQDDLKEQKGSVWAVVKEDNLPSIAVLKKTGFVQVGYSQKKLWSHCFTKEQTHLHLFTNKPL